ncbi:MAG: hypothetical protein OEX22_12665 [Cyclobacteriaceae bacterium]|nr:hypothetical protein [Cyclobacteriaceae bacterium]
MKLTKLLVVTSLIVVSCSTSNKNEGSAEQVINKAIEVAGGALFENTTIKFDFREKHYQYTRNGGTYQYERIFTDSLNVIRDVLNNEGFERFINDTVASVTPDSMKVKYANSVNSVLYFALLPYGLNDDAVIKTYLGESMVKDKWYHKIKITFKKEGGGKDHEDVFVYWVEKENFTVDYFAYTYNTDGGGARFRSAFNPRNINGIRIVDYINYKPTNNQYSVEAFDEAFQKNELTELSRIETENVKVETRK